MQELDLIVPPLINLLKVGQLPAAAVTIITTIKQREVAGIAEGRQGCCAFEVQACFFIARYIVVAVDLSTS